MPQILCSPAVCAESVQAVRRLDAKRVPVRRGGDHGRRARPRRAGHPGKPHPAPTRWRSVRGRMA